MNLLLKGGRLLDPAHAIDQTADLLVTGSVIAAVGPDMAATEARVIDCSGRVVCPGFIDLQAHFRDPGEEHKEDIVSGSRAAARGGFVAVCVTPDTEPPVDSGPMVSALLDKAQKAAVVRLLPIGALSKGRLGQELAEIGDMAAAGAVAISDGHRPVAAAELMRLALLYARQFGVPVFSHCEDAGLAQGGAMHLGRWSTLLGLRGLDPVAEEVHVARDLLLSEATGAPLHLLHISTARSVALIRAAKARGVPVTSSVTPHHLVLTDADLANSSYDSNLKVMPPLRGEADRQALLNGLADGTLDCIISDHAPQHRDDKELEFGLARDGMTALETAVPLLLDRVVGPGLLPLNDLVLRMSTAPARILGRRVPALQVGAPADITVLNLKGNCTIRAEEMASRSRNSPFIGWELAGQPVATIVAGNLVMEEGRIVAV